MLTSRPDSPRPVCTHDNRARLEAAPFYEHNWLNTVTIRYTASVKGWKLNRCLFSRAVGVIAWVSYYALGVMWSMENTTISWAFLGCRAESGVSETQESGWWCWRAWGLKWSGKQPRMLLTRREVLENKVPVALADSHGCLHARTYMHMRTHPVQSLLFCLSVACLSVFVSVCLCVCLSLFLSDCLSVSLNSFFFIKVC